MIRNQRASSIGISRLFLSVGVGAIMYYIVDTVTSPIFARASETNTAGSAGAQGTQYLGTGVDFLPIAFAFIAFFGLIAYSVFTREVLG